MFRHIALVSQRRQLPLLAENKVILPAWKQGITDGICSIAEVLQIDSVCSWCEMKERLQ